MTRRPGSILAALALALAPQMVAPDSPTPAAAPLVLPGTIVLYSWATDRCAEWDIPDTPARLWRGPDGSLTLIAGAEVNRASVGAAPEALARDCRPRLEGPRRADPAALSDRWWIASVHAHGDGRIEALVHAEYHGHAHPGACSAGAYLPCWRNAILAATSRDGGLSFTVDSAHPVAALPYPYDRGQRARSGYFSPSNMILSDGALYAFIFAEAYGAQRRGVCLIRRPVAGGASDWRAWDGAGFTARLDGRAADGRPSGEGPAVCTPLPGLRGNLTSVVAHRGRFLAVSPMTARGPDGIAQPGFWLLQSADLVHWSRPELLVALPLLWQPDCTLSHVHAYPALIDPASPDRNFAIASDRVWLTFVRMRLGSGCRPGPERDLVALTVILSGDGSASRPD